MVLFGIARSSFRFSAFPLLCFAQSGTGVYLLRMSMIPSMISGLG